MSSRHNLVILFLIGAFAGSGCNVDRESELGAQDCDDGRDNDSDGLTDCLDPGCFALDLCRDAATDLPPPPPPPVTGADTGTMPPGLPDSGPPVLRDAAPETDGATPLVDAGGCDLVGCPTGQVCMGGSCVPEPEPGPRSFLLSVLSATVPTRDPITTICLDPCTVPAGVCAQRCYPDPFVTVDLETSEGAALVGMTEVVPNASTPSFGSTPPYPVTLAEGDTLIFTVYDDDLLQAAQQLFTCSVTLGVPMNGSIQCADGSHSVQALLSPLL